MSGIIHGMSEVLAKISQRIYAGIFRQGHLNSVGKEIIANANKYRFQQTTKSSLELMK